jgi:hypothetical protein
MGVKQSIDNLILDTSLKAYLIANTDVKNIVKESAIFVLKGYFGGFHSNSHKSINEIIENTRVNSEEFSKHPVSASIKLFKYIKNNYQIVDNYHILSDTDFNLQLTKSSISLGFVLGTICFTMGNYTKEHNLVNYSFNALACWEYIQAITRSIHVSYFQTPIGSFKFEGLGEIVKPFVPFFNPFFNFFDKSISEIAKTSGPFIDGIQKSVYSLGPPNLKYLTDNPVVNYIKGFIK